MAGWAWLGDAATLPPQAPHTLLYTSFLLRTCACDSFAEGVAALLPCFWVYAHVGDLMLANREQHQGARPKPFDAWIDMYAGDGFQDAVLAYRALVERAARDDPGAVPKMQSHFHTSCHLENMFWTQAQDKLPWPQP